MKSCLPIALIVTLLTGITFGIVWATYYDKDDRCKTAYYEMWSVNRCLETTGCFTMQKDLHNGKMQSRYYDKHCAAYEKRRFQALPTISATEGENETSLDTRHTSP
jgi:hypothetical protein